jgi:cytochrome c peroxidase
LDDLGGSSPDGVGLIGNRRPPSNLYASFSPILRIDSDGTIRGGNFWDGRATGWMLGNAAVDQVQLQLPDANTTVALICSASYGGSFRDIYGDVACQDSALGFDQTARAVVAHQSSFIEARFSSDFDELLFRRGDITSDQQRGRTLFEGKAHCSRCHPSTVSDGVPPIFSDFSFANIGVPANGGPVDDGLGGFLRSLQTSDDWRALPFVPVSFKRLSGEDLEHLADDNRGKMRVPTLRNVDKRAAYTHNGWFKSLSSLVHFYNTRDVLPACAAQLSEADALAQNCWPPPEAPETVDHTNIGALGLTSDEEAAIVAFLATVSDE